MRMTALRNWPPRPASGALNSARAFLKSTACGIRRIWLIALMAGALAPVAGRSDTRLDACDPDALEAAVAAGGTVTFGCNGTIRLTRTLTISQNTQLDATGRDVVIDGGNEVRLLLVSHGAALGVTHLTFAHGRSVEGGAILVQQGSLSVDRCLFLGNRAVSPAPPNDVETATTRGGAVHLVEGTVECRDSAFIENRAESGIASHAALGGAVSAQAGSLGFWRTEFRGNLANGEGVSAGGAIHAAGSGLVLDQCRFVTNLVVVGDQGPASGGALHVERVTHAAARVTDSRFEGNRCEPSLSRTYTRGAEARGGAIANRGVLHGTRCEFSANLAMAAGSFGGTVRNPSRGGALWSDGDLTLEDSLLLANRARGHEGTTTIRAPGPRAGSEAQGGGLYTEGRARVSGTTLAGNVAEGGEGASIPGFPPGEPGDAWGGALFAAGDVTLLNSTFVTNRASGGSRFAPSNPAQGHGGALYVASGTFVGSHLTVAANAARFGGLTFATDPEDSPGAGDVGGILVAAEADATLTQSILADPEAGANCGGGFTTARRNLSTDRSCSFGNRLGWDGTDAGLGDYGNHGGPTPTIALLESSVVLEAGIPAGCPATDQRGWPRTPGNACDLGAFEFGAEPAIRTGRIVGVVHGAPTPGLIRIRAGDVSASPDWKGQFHLSGLPTGWIEVTASAEELRFRPSSIRVAVIENAEVSVEFRAYPVGVLTLERTPAGTDLILAGDPQSRYAIGESSDLATWIQGERLDTDAGGIAVWAVPPPFGTETRRFYRAFGPSPGHAWTPFPPAAN